MLKENRTGFGSAHETQPGMSGAVRRSAGRESFTPPAVGGVSLLVVFGVLCLTVFALLSLSTARAGKRTSEVSAQAVADYYKAECRAQEILACLRQGEVPVGVTEADGVYGYSCPISETQVLEVEVRAGDGKYQILRWQAVAQGVREPDDSLHLWGGPES